mgnify:FL=1
MYYLTISFGFLSADKDYFLIYFVYLTFWLILVFVFVLWDALVGLID